jgi:hypothetical protein
VFQNTSFWKICSKPGFGFWPSFAAESQGINNSLRFPKKVLQRAIFSGIALIHQVTLIYLLKELELPVSRRSGKSLRFSTPLVIVHLTFSIQQQGCGWGSLTTFPQAPLGDPCGSSISEQEAHPFWSHFEKSDGKIRWKKER